MTPFITGCLGMALLVVAIFLRVPIGMGMIGMGALGFAAISGLDSALAILRSVPYETYVNYNYCVVPLFLIMGNFAFKSGISNDLYYAVHRLMGKVKGGLAMATIAACGAFAAICGSSVACAVTMGVVALPEMKKYKYDSGLATGVLAAGGTLGILIPPSTIMLLYGIIAEQSIGELFMAGFIPGILQAAMYIVLVGWLVKRKPELGPAGTSCTIKEKYRRSPGSGVSSHFLYSSSEASIPDCSHPMKPQASALSEPSCWASRGARGREKNSSSTAWWNPLPPPA